MDSGSLLKAGLFTLKEELLEGWHTIMLSFEGTSLFAAVDNGNKGNISESRIAGTGGAELVLGDPEQKCNTFIGCIKDLVCITSTSQARVSTLRSCLA